MKIVKNNCYGGFGLSLEAEKEYLKLKGKEAFFYKQTKYTHRDKVNEYIRVDDLKDNFLFVSCLTVDLGKTTDNLKYGDGEYFSSRDIPRNDPDLITVIDKLGEKANGRCASLSIIEIPDDVEWEVDEYDGLETIREKHRSW
tara:strand:- start:580 stop:1005 length:426 start_codon:yes stop_codon:yes gene_type:complete